MVGRPMPGAGMLGERNWLRFKHPVVRYQVLGTDLRSSAVLTLSLLLPTFPHGPHIAIGQIFSSQLTIYTTYS